MRTLIIYRGETQVAQVTLTGKTMKLGRGKDNDIVLDDPGKGVSRVHAELRPEGDRYRLVDLQSQNGTWVSGERVPSVVLAPGVVAALGPFRVAIDPKSPQTQSIPIVTEEALRDTGTEISQPLPGRPSAPTPPVVAESAGLLDDLAPADDESRPATQPPARPAAASANPAPVPSSATAPPGPPVPPRTRAASRALLLVVAGVVLVLACGIGAYTFFRSKPKPQPVWDRAAATALVDRGRCQEALDQQINRALAAQPDNAEALQLKAKCTAPPAVPTTTTVPAPVAETTTEKLDKAEAALQANACQAALDAANEVLAADGNDERAKTVAQKAGDCLKPPPPPGTPNVAIDPVVRVAPAQGGLDPLDGETGKKYKARMAGTRKRYDDAVALLQSQRYQQASRELDALDSQVPQGYLELAQRRAEARNALREESKRAYAAAQEAEQRSDWNTATVQYQRAHEFDPSRDVTPDLTRMSEAKGRLGRQLCSDADAEYTLGHNTAAADKYTRALALLPNTDACYAKAKERLAKIGG